MTLTSFEPATGATLWTGAIGDVDAEVAAARAGWAGWAAKPFAFRVETLRRFANVARAKLELSMAAASAARSGETSFGRSGSICAGAGVAGRDLGASLGGGGGSGAGRAGSGLGGSGWGAKRTQDNSSSRGRRAPANRPQARPPAVRASTRGADVPTRSFPRSPPCGPPTSHKAPARPGPRAREPPPLRAILPHQESARRRLKYESAQPPKNSRPRACPE